jgi:hypothetical protein
LAMSRKRNTRKKSSKAFKNMNNCATAFAKSRKRNSKWSVASQKGSYQLALNSRKSIVRRM